MNEEIVEVARASFSTTYFEARRKFTDLALDVRSYPSPALGPSGEKLSTDVAWFGDARAAKVGVIISSNHGVEGYCGSAGQVDWMAHGGPVRLRADEAMLLIHAINPYGFAWDRRVTQEGCDLNRNFVDFSAPIPHNRGYDELADHLVPRELDGDVFASAEAAIKRFRDAHGETEFQKARKSGQYRHPTGMFFGGARPSAARLTLERIVADFDLAARNFVLVVDYHTGLGPYGYGELQCEQASGMSGYQRATEIFGGFVTSPDLGTSSSVALNGTMDEYWQRTLADRHVYVALEFGTYDPEQGRRVLREDHWLYAYGDGDLGSALAKRIRTAIRQHYYPEAMDWKEAVLSRSRQVQRQMLEGLRRFG
jgi:hypothetical protein